MVAVALFLGMLGWGLARGLTSGWLARRAAGIAAVAMATLVYWNHEAWIVRQNVERFRRTHQLDTAYLVWELSPNAAPALVRAIPELPPLLAESVRDGLRQRYGTTPRGAPCRWFEWNRGRERAGAALGAGGIVRGDAQDCTRSTAFWSAPRAALPRDRDDRRTRSPGARARSRRTCAAQGSRRSPRWPP